MCVCVCLCVCVCVLHVMTTGGYHYDTCAYPRLYALPRGNMYPPPHMPYMYPPPYMPRLYALPRGNSQHALPHSLKVSLTLCMYTAWSCAARSQSTLAEHARRARSQSTLAEHARRARSQSTLAEHARRARSQSLAYSMYVVRYVCSKSTVALTVQKMRQEIGTVMSAKSAASRRSASR